MASQFLYFTLFYRALYREGKRKRIRYETEELPAWNRLYYCTRHGRVIDPTM